MKKTIMLIVVILSLTLIIQTVDAEFWLCLKEKEMMKYCNDYKQPFTCDSKMGCQRCMLTYKEAENCYFHGSWRKCLELTQECSVFDNNKTIDSEPPILNVSSPVEGRYYGSKTVPFQIQVNELSSLYYYDNVNGKGSWTRFCDKCMDFSKTITVSEGFNNITIKASDVLGNPSYFTVTFYVDSIAPQIWSTRPKQGVFGNGVFGVSYTETDLKNITLYYKKDAFWSSMTKSCSSGNRQSCEFNAPLPKGQYSLTYYFGVSDHVNTKYSPETTVYIDTVVPSLKVFSPQKPMEIFNSKNVQIDIRADEKVAFDYIDTVDKKPKWANLCTKCESYNKTKSFGEGSHKLIFRATDPAGNSVNMSRLFIVDSIKPKIKKVEPKTGLTNGLITLEFKEDNPKKLILNYGNESGLFGHADISIDDDCSQYPKGSYSCYTYANFEPYDGMSLIYWFNLTDIADNYYVSKISKVVVDVTPPEINYINYTIKGVYVNFKIGVTEKNFDEILYRDNSGEFMSLCSQLTGGICQASKKFNSGLHNVTIQVTDRAGNSIAQNMNPFTI